MPNLPYVSSVHSRAFSQPAARKCEAAVPTIAHGVPPKPIPNRHRSRLLKMMTPIFGDGTAFDDGI